MNKTSLVALAAVPILLASCIPAEDPNTECDIEAISLHLESPTDIFYHDYDTMQTVISTETDIEFTIRSYANVQSIPTTLRITEGATAYIKSTDGTDVPFLNGSAVDFSNEKVQRFHIVSEDKAWSRDYTISVVLRASTMCGMLRKSSRTGNGKMATQVSRLASRRQNLWSILRRPWLTAVPTEAPALSSRRVIRVHSAGW